MPQDKEKDDILDQIEQMQLDAIILEQAYENAWLVLSGQITFDELMGNQFEVGRELIMPYDPESGPSEHDIQNMISFFIDTEEYERCAKLQTILASFPQISE